MEETKIMMKIDDAAKAYLDEKKALNSFSKATLRNRSIWLKKLQEYFKSINIVYVHEIHKNAITSYLSSLKVSNNTKLTIMLDLNSFLDYLVETELIIDNYAARMKKPKKEKKEQPVLFDGDIDKLTDAVIDNCTEKFIDRDLLIVSFILNTAVRVTELVNLNIDDIDIDNLEFKVKRKGGKEAYLPYSEQIQEMIQIWFQQREKEFNVKPGERALFVSTRGTRIAVRTVQELIKKYMTKAGLIKSQMGPHLIRRTSLTKMIEESDIKTVQEIAGHEDMRTTAIYVKTNKRRMRKAVESRLPLKGRNCL